MSENSRNAKTWCISLISALLIFSSKALALPWFIMVLPILPLMYIDMYYLALETFYRQEYNVLKQQYKEGLLDLSNVYDMGSPNNGNLHILFQIRSKSVWPFYGLLIFIASAIGWYLEHQTKCLGL